MYTVIGELMSVQCILLKINAFKKYYTSPFRLTIFTSYSARKMYWVLNN
jgi:hypothetical protein